MKYNINYLDANSLPSLVTIVTLSITVDLLESLDPNNDNILIQKMNCVEKIIILSNSPPLPRRLNGRSITSLLKTTVPLNIIH